MDNSHALINYPVEYILGKKRLKNSHNSFIPSEKRTIHCCINSTNDIF